MAALILRDSARLQEQDAAYLNRIEKTRHSPALPLYDGADAERALERFKTRPFNRPFAVRPGVRARFRRAGHILGAAIVEIEWGSRRVVFSGDLGRYDDPVMWDPEPVPEADFVVIESTYGDRLHDGVDAASALLEVVARTTKRGGTVIIPSFAVGRAQSLLYYLWSLRESGRLPDVPIYLDSPMAIDASDLLHAHNSDHRLDWATCTAVCRIATYTRSAEESKRITASRDPKIVVSASGMATGGRILHHVKTFGPDPRNTILITGFQAAGTRGRALLEGRRELRIHGDRVDIGAEVATLPMLSAHADANELLRWLRGFREAPERVFVVHGEPQAADTFRSRVDHELGWPAVVPRPNQVFTL
ncbi:MBL fold metallo-hydrolase RNA specificity domain-containing protein [Nocardioides limicola]|uniref:MBL fold metallo-hydrolase RNA specificity domain-containing protein n=1 Tax=Nocardioides limicola TaxID=2803368 RepID=UPI00193C449D|nr:MBL fold metallo-hydrolase [Nocardioides sp. DJM-14]